jgi:ubiquinone/menaquinone biosynthesis C-methylase UbiE
MTMSDTDLHARRFSGEPDRLRSAERVALLEVPRVVALSVEGLNLTSVLDVGTGTGLFAEAFSALGIAREMQVAGVDTNAQLLDLARAHVPAAGFTEAPAEALPYEDITFDLVFLGLVLHEVDDFAQALREAHRVARIRVAVLEWRYREEEKGPPLAHRLSPETIKDLAAQVGFRAVEAIPLQRLALYRLTP